MIAWVLYDISSDKARTKVSKLCQKSGLHRVQYSCFLGEIDKNRKDSLELQIEGLIDIETDSVYIFPMSKDELQQTTLLGQAFDKELVSSEVKALFI